MTRASRGYDEREYSLTDGSADFSVLTREFLSPGCPVSIEGELDRNSRIIAKSVRVLHGNEANMVYSRVSAKIKSNIKLESTEPLVSDDFTPKLVPSMREIAIELRCAKKLGRPISLRFHGDADGIAGAIALSSILYCKTYQQNSAIYSVRDALRDIDSAGQEPGHLAIFIDFGSNEASVEGIRLLRAAGIQVIIIDHHPFVSEPGTTLLNPLQHAEKTSRYTAGYMACEIALLCGLERQMAMSLAQTACAGDKSDIIPIDAASKKQALVLDFVASHVSFGNKLDFYKNVLSKQELFDSIFHQAEEEIAEAANKAMIGMRRIETQNTRLEIVSFSLEKIVKKGEWPPSSKITTRIYDTLNAQMEPPGSRPLICLGSTDRSVIIRLNEAAAALGFSAHALAEKLKVSMADFVEGGGGHVKAGAIRAKVGFTKEVVGELIREINEQPSRSASLTKQLN